MRLVALRGLAVACLICSLVFALPLAPASQAQAPLAELNPRGTWSADVQYLRDDLVTSRGSAWRARRNNIGKVPGSTDPSTALDWERFAAGFNPLGVWGNSLT